MKKFVKKYYHLTFFIIISLFANFYTLTHRGIPFRYDWNWPVFSPNIIWKFLSTADTGVISVLTKNISLLFAAFGSAMINTEVFLRVFLFLISFFAGYGAYVFIRKRVSDPVSLIFGVIYALSPYVFIRTIVGFLWSLVSYALLPIFLHLYLNIKPKKIYHFILLGFLLSLIFAQIQAGLLLLLVLFIHLLITIFRRESPLNEIRTFGLTLLFFALFSLPWLIYIWLHQQNVEVVSGNAATTIGYMSLVPHSFRNMLMLSDHQITSPFFYPLSHDKLFLLGWIIVWLVAFCAIFNKTNRRLVWTFIISSLLVLPFIKGPLGAFGKFYIWFYNHVPQIAVFRETYHFELLYTISLCVLFAFGLDWLWLNISRLTGKAKNKQLNSSLKIGAKTFLAGGALFIIMPYFTLNYAGYFKLQSIPPEYNQLHSFLQNNKDYCHKIYYPPGLGFIYFKGDSAPDASNTDVIAYSLGIPYLDDGTTFSYLPSEEKFYRNELVSQFYEPSDNGEFAYLLKQGGIDCVVTKLDTDTKYWLASNLGKEKDHEVNKKWRNTDYLTLIESKKGLELQKQFGKNIGIYKLNQQSRISDEEYRRTIEQSVGKNAIEQFAGMKILQFPLIEWATGAAYYKDGWSRGRYDFWRKHLFTELRQDFAYTDRPSSQITGKVAGSGSCSLAARYLDGGAPGSFIIDVDGQKITAAKNPGSEKFIWKNLGQLNISDGNTTITNIKGENAIADLVCLY